jgi:hypothetical protein
VGIVTTTLVFCAGRNRRYAEIALAHGFAYGCRSDYRPLFPVAFADLNWRAPDRERHLAFVREHRPALAVAPDVLRLDALPDTLAYAEQLASHASRVAVVPKCAGVMEALPRVAWLVIGYSVPTPYGGADGVLLPELAGWPVHLLGGTPHAQLHLARYLDVVSADGNAHMKAAAFHPSGRARRWVNGHHDDPTFDPGRDAPYRAFERSCAHIAAAWAAWDGGTP